jgi:uncharacterized protein YeaO (DUF488 family)
MTRQPLRTKRAYEPADTADGIRVLVDRLWPVPGAREDRSLAEGNRSERRRRRRFHRDHAAWGDFKAAYYAELEEVPAQSAAHTLLDQLTREPVTLLFAARDETRNNAVAPKS